MTENHCEDCCCAKSWEALGIDTYTGRSIPEEIELLSSKNSILRRDFAERGQIIKRLEAQVERLQSVRDTAMTLVEAMDDDIYDIPSGTFCIAQDDLIKALAESLDTDHDV